MPSLAPLSGSGLQGQEQNVGEQRAESGAEDCGTDLAGVLPVHGVDGRPGIHVHQVVVVVARHHPPAPVVELHGEGGVLDVAHTRWVDGVWVVAAPPGYLEAAHHPRVGGVAGGGAERQWGSMEWGHNLTSLPPQTSQTLGYFGWGRGKTGK